MYVVISESLTHANIFVNIVNSWLLTLTSKWSLYFRDGNDSRERVHKRRPHSQNDGIEAKNVVHMEFDHSEGRVAQWFKKTLLSMTVGAW